MTNARSRAKTSSCRPFGHLWSSSWDGQRPRYMKLRTRIQTFTNRALHNDQNLLRESPGPLLPKHFRQARGSGKIAVVAASERRTTAKALARQREKPVRVLKIHLGKHETHELRLILEVRGFDSSPPSLCSDGAAFFATAPLPPHFLGFLFPPISVSFSERAWLSAFRSFHFLKLQRWLGRSVPGVWPRSHPILSGKPELQ